MILFSKSNESRSPLYSVQALFQRTLDYIKVNLLIRSIAPVTNQITSVGGVVLKEMNLGMNLRNDSND